MSLSAGTKIKRFLMLKGDQTKRAETIVVVLNWLAEVAAKVPARR